MSNYAPVSSTQRSGLQKTRDVALTVMAILFSIVCLLLLYVSVAAGSALSDLNDRLEGGNTPGPAATVELPPALLPTGSTGEECIGEEPVPGC